MPSGLYYNHIYFGLIYWTALGNWANTRSKLLKTHSHKKTNRKINTYSMHPEIDRQVIK